MDFGHNDLSLATKYSGDIYFESAGTILTLITFGKFLEAKSKGKTSDAISKLINLSPKTATVFRNGAEEIINTEDIVLDDIIIIRPGDSIPVDGVLIEGYSLVNQAAITGESMPVEKNVGDEVISGSINKNGFFKMKATKVGENTTLSRIIKLVEEAGSSKAPISKIADKVSFVFVPTVIVISIITFIIWILSGQSFEFALTSSIAVLVISCPCALGLATPVAIMVATGKGAENGILVKSAESLEMLHLIDTVVFDKTGTITEGKPKVTKVISLDSSMDEKDILKIAASLEIKSEHPLAESILEEANKKNISTFEIDNFEAISGKGIKGKVPGKLYYAGNLNFIIENNCLSNIKEDELENLKNVRNTCIYIASNYNLIGRIEVEDTIKKSSISAIDKLKREKIDVVMLTGDNKNSSNLIGEKVGIKNVISEVLPQDKEKQIEILQNQNKKVAFVGDGINDSPALVKADVGIAIGSGTDIAIESADVVLIKDDLKDVVRAIDLSKATIKNIKMNLFWAFFYNIIGIPIAAGVFYNSFGLKLNPMIGALAMSLSSVCVVTNALRLRNLKSKFKEDIKKMNSKTIEIEGMQCNHCKMSVEKALNSIEGVEKVEVSLENKNAVIEASKDIDDSTIKNAIDEAGFSVKSIK